MEAMTRRYPTQDQGESIAEYFSDYEQLAVQRGIGRVVEAVAALRIDPEQIFFPRPDEIAAEMKRQRLRRLPPHVYAQG
ncbi:MAG TPA: hypothetical protein VII58_00875 [Acidobacteriaceae bacterium]